MSSHLPYGVGDITWNPSQTTWGRVLKPQTLDFESATWEMVQLVSNPKKMYKSQYYKQMGRSRSDPSFYILETALLVVLALAWGVAFLPHWWQIIKLIVYMVVIDFFLVGGVISLALWFIVNQLLMPLAQGLNKVEWQYCWDIHCNAFLVVWVALYVVQLIILPILRFSLVLGVLLGNTLYLGAIGYYFVITFYGYNALPFATAATLAPNPVKKIQMAVVTVVLPLLALIWLVTVVLGINLSRTMIDSYFGN